MKRGILSCFILVLVLLCGCGGEEPEAAGSPSPEAQPPVFQTGQHEWDTLYKQQFDTRYTTNDGITFHMQASIFDEDQAVSLLDTVAADAAKINAAFDTGIILNIYVVRETLDGTVHATPDELVCAADDITSGEYHNGLIAAALDVTEPWQMTGAWQYVCGIKPDAVKLAAYYSEPENMPVLSLFAGYFNETFADDKTIETAQETAGAFSAYLIENYGLEVFRNAGMSEDYRQGWLESVGVTGTYTLPYDVSFWEGAHYASSDEWPLIASKDDRVFYFAINEEELNTPSDIMQFVDYYTTNMQMIMEMIQEQAPQAYEVMSSKWDQTITGYIGWQGGQSGFVGGRSHWKGFSIYCRLPSHAIHETAHMLIPTDNWSARTWIIEGIAEYFRGLAYPAPLHVYNIFNMNADEFEGDDRIFFEQMKQYYLERAEYPEELEDFSYSLFDQAVVVTARERTDLDITLTFASQTAAEHHGGAGTVSPIAGNELTIPEATLFTAYLVDTCGLESVIQFVMDADLGFTQTFGIEYEDALAGFYASLEIGESN